LVFLVNKCDNDNKLANGRALHVQNMKITKTKKILKYTKTKTKYDKIRLKCKSKQNMKILKNKNTNCAKKTFKKNVLIKHKNVIMK